MHIKNVRSDSFAGINSLNVDFEKGMNVVFGKNETGKSTLIDLIYSILLKNVKLKGKEKTEFYNLYFPNTTSTISSDTVDGEIKIETDDGIYKLTKNWGADESCKLIMPDGSRISDNERINEVLAPVLGYGKAIYDELLFSSQKRNETVLSHLLGSVSDTAVDELSAKISKTVDEYGGIDVNKLGNLIEQRIKEYGGRWDIVNNVPEGNKQYSNGNGFVTDAYYKYYDLNKKINEISVLEEQQERYRTAYISNKSEFDEVSKERDEFTAFRSVLDNINKTQTILDGLRRDLKEKKEALNDWPELEKKLAIAESLQKEKMDADLLHRYEELSDAKKLVDESKTRLQKIGFVDEGDLENAKQAERNISLLEGRLSGMSISAKLTLQDGYTVNVKSLVSGDTIDINNDEFDVCESVDISVPGVMSMTLMPKGVDVNEITSRLQEQRQQLANILSKYNVVDVGSLERRASEYRDANNEYEKYNTSFSLLLGTDDYIEIENGSRNVSVTRSKEIIDSDIRAFCPNGEINSIINQMNFDLSSYKKNYGSYESLLADISSLEESIQKNEDELQSGSLVPEKYQRIVDPNAYANELKNRCEQLREIQESSFSEYTKISTQLESESSTEDLQTELAAIKADYLNKLDALRHWLHIRKVFVQTKAASNTNPVQGIEDKFRKNVSLLSANSIVVERLDEKVKGSIVSGNNRLVDGLLSEGTKDTISLAFRLAVIEDLFPQGGAIVIFDDAFADMDAERKIAAANLLKNFAEKNQVIFTTCDQNTAELLGGAKICF